MCERQDLKEPEVTVAYREMTTSVQRVSEYVRYVDKKVFVYCAKEVYRSNYKLYELEEMLSQTGFVRVSRSVLLNVEKLTGIKTLANSKCRRKVKKP